MDRRKTILIAVLVNAGLLVMLFIMALHQEEAPLVHIEPKPLAQERGPLFPEHFQDLEMQEVAPLAASFEEKRELPEEALQPLHLLPPPALAVQQTPLPPTPQREEKPLAEVTVKKGDTLEKIARLNQTSVEEIIRINQLSSNFLRIGQVLKLPPEKAVAAVQKPPQLADPKIEYYTVKVGDNPWTIAMKHHLKVDELLKLNSLNEEKARRLKPGDRLRIR